MGLRLLSESFAGTNFPVNGFMVAQDNPGSHVHVQSKT